MGLKYHPVSELYGKYLLHPSISTDSRTVVSGDLFFALKGPAFNGNQFASQALEGGAAYAVVDDPDVVSDERILLVKDVQATLRDLAALHRSNIHPSVIAITGSNGKTTTKELIHAVLSKKFTTVATQGNLNNHIGVPVTILRASSATRMLVIEMGANHLGEIAALSELARPDHGIITNIGQAHLEGFGSLEGVKKAKSELYAYLHKKGSGLVFRNAGDSVLEDTLSAFRIHVVTYGASVRADVHGSLVPGKPNLELTWKGKTTVHHCSTNLAGDYNFPNVMAAIAVGLHFGVGEIAINEAISQYQPANNRSQLHQTASNLVVIDCYNANPVSMRVAINHFMQMGYPEPMLILGDMFELGDYSDEEHRQLLRMVSGLKCDVKLVGKVLHGMAHEFGLESFENAEQLAEQLRKSQLKRRQVLLKGSRGVMLEKLIPYL